MDAQQHRPDGKHDRRPVGRDAPPDVDPSQHLVFDLYQVARIGERDRVCVKKSAETVSLVQSPDMGAVVTFAGIVRDNVFPAMSGEDWDVVLKTNLDGFYNVLRPLIMPMVRRRAPGRPRSRAAAR